VKKLSCIVGRHTWTTHIEQGEEFRICSECGKEPREPGRGTGPDMSLAETQKAQSLDLPP